MTTTKKCDACEQEIARPQFPQSPGLSELCKDCDSDMDNLVMSQYEEAIANGEPWAVDDPELWHPKYRPEGER